MTTQSAKFVVDAYELKARISYEFDPVNVTRKFKCTVSLWLPANEKEQLHHQFINPNVLACGDYLSQEWGCYDSSTNYRKSEMTFSAYGWGSSQAIARDYLANCIRTVKGVFRRNQEALDALPEALEETYTVA
ncbi:MAG: hypothetical protein Fur0042_12610 [Cyanophyceae cyanobacterium]